MTCLCLTRNRREWLPKAIQCWRAQTYPNRELLIVADGVNVKDLVPPDDAIRLVHVDGPVDIGTKRNFGCDRAASIVAHWDDDDHSEPGRLSDQVARLLDSGKAVTGYRSMRFTNGERWWRYRGAADYALGTSLVYRRDWWDEHQFPAVMVAEDGAFVHAAAEAGELVTVDGDAFMHATIHAGNTSPRSLGGDNWTEL